MQVLDLKGQSGAIYRFRHVPTASDLPAHAGGFVVAHLGGPTVQISICGTRRSLVELAELWHELAPDRGRLFVRLNVSRAVRLAEHEDLIAALKPAEVLTERD